jgi:hypothetical protein
MDEVSGAGASGIISGIAIVPLRARVVISTGRDESVVEATAASPLVGGLNIVPPTTGVT